MSDFYRKTLKEKGLKVTPQRVAIFEAITHLKNHPTAENIIAYIKKNHPNISVGTVYKVLDSFVENKLLSKVKTEKDIMRYDSVLTNHHHLYCTETGTPAHSGSYGEQPARWVQYFFIIKNTMAKKQKMIQEKAKKDV